MPRAFVGLGANVGEAQARLRWAARELESLGAVRLSSLWASAPVGPIVDQPWFLNAVCRLDTSLEPRALLAKLHAIEAAAGRDRAVERPKGPRPLDLDLLLYDEVVLAEADIVVPHPRVHERAFALAPLVELAGPDLLIPGVGPIGELLEAVRKAQPIACICQAIAGTATD
jgi:2-amino-4-hydroxy-6-hydroxymethyldihydropteridine diphosphokinase